MARTIESSFDLMAWESQGDSAGKSLVDLETRDRGDSMSQSIQRGDDVSRSESFLG